MAKTVEYEGYTIESRPHHLGTKRHGGSASSSPCKLIMASELANSHRGHVCRGAGSRYHGIALVNALDGKVEGQSVHRYEDDGSPGNACLRVQSAPLFDFLDTEGWVLC